MKIRLLKQSHKCQQIQQNIKTQCNILHKMDIFQQSVKYCHRRRSLSKKIKDIRSNNNNGEEQEIKNYNYDDRESHRSKDKYRDGEARGSVGKSGLNLLQNKQKVMNGNSSSHKLNGKKKQIYNEPVKLKNKHINDQYIDNNSKNNINSRHNIYANRIEPQHNNNNNNKNIYHGSWGIPRYFTQQTPPISTKSITQHTAQKINIQVQRLRQKQTFNHNNNDMHKFKNNSIFNNFDNSRIYQLYDHKINQSAQLQNIKININNNNNININNNYKETMALKSASIMDQSQKMSKNNMLSTRISNTNNNNNINNIHFSNNFPNKDKDYYDNSFGFNDYFNNNNKITDNVINNNNQYRFSNSSILNKNQNHQQFRPSYFDNKNNNNSEHKQLFSVRSQTLLTPFSNSNPNNINNNSVNISRAISRTSRKTDRKRVNHNNIKNLQDARQVNTVFSGDLSHVRSHSHHSQQIYQHNGYINYGNQLVPPQKTRYVPGGKLQKNVNVNNVLQESIVIGSNNSNHFSLDFWS